MKKFDRIVFWCEFPKEVDWNKFNKIISFNIEVYIAARSKKEFNYWKSKIKSKYVKEVGVWPTISENEGYWFSGYSSKDNIDLLKEFKRINMKIDLEPPLLFKEYNFYKLLYIYSKFLFSNRPKNSDYLRKNILDVSKKTKVILSGFPFPKFLSKLYGDEHLIGENIYRNFFIYSTLTPRLFRPLNNIYNRYFIKKAIKKFTSEKTMIAVGCIGHGILGNEPQYKSVKEFEKDLEFVEKQGIKNIVIFDLAGIMNRSNPEEWFLVLKSTQIFINNKR